MNNYLVTFAKGTEQEVTYPVEAKTKKAAREEFSVQYIGYSDEALCSLLHVQRDEETEEE